MEFELEITEEFDDTFRLLEESNQNVFLTGEAGTGKSTFLKFFCDHTEKKYVKLAPTGVSALNVGGMTLHSFFGLPPRLLNPHKLKIKKDKIDLIKNLDLLIIDEISMVRADIFDSIDIVLRKYRETDEAFGGIQLLLIGDVYQIPPVVQGEELVKYFNEYYSGPYFFNSKIYSELDIRTIQLSKIFRQTDEEFIKNLNRIRNSRELSLAIQCFNKRLIQELHVDFIDPIITVTTTNRKASDINNYHLRLLEGDSYELEADIEGEFDKSSFPTDQKLVLKKGSQVMLLRNDFYKRWQNGSIGVVKDVLEKSIIVEIDGFDHEIEKVSWEKIEYTFNPNKNDIEHKEIGVFKQYPLKLAWAITIHKSQGKTFDRVIIDLDRGAFAHGQTYVALSRCRSLEEIYLSRPLRNRDVILDSKVIEFMDGLIQ